LNIVPGFRFAHPGYGMRKRSNSVVMPGLVPGIHVFLPARKDVDGRDKPGHDEERAKTLAQRPKPR
jgi:hypothetical protein